MVEMLDGPDFLKMAVALFVMIDPIGAAPIFMSLTARHTPSERARIALIASATAVALLVATALVGRSALNMFGISIASFRMVGGILFLLIGFDMLNVRQSRTRHTPEEDSEAASRHEMALVPLGIPLLAGPGAIGTVLLLAHSSPEFAVRGAVIGVICGMGLVVYVILRLAGPLGRLLGATGINILTRLMGLVTGAIGIEQIAAGAKELLPILAGTTV